MPAPTFASATLMTPAEPVLQATRLTYGYRAGRPILDSLDLTIHPGTVTAVTGPSGRGKSTLLYLLAGMLTPWSGGVRCAGRLLTDLPDAERARVRATFFGFVFQDVVLDPRRTVLDAVLEPTLYAGLPRSAYEADALALLERMGVSAHVSARPGEMSGAGSACGRLPCPPSGSARRPRR